MVMKMVWGNLKVYGTWWCGWFVFALLMGADKGSAAASATGSLILPIGFLLVWMAWSEAVRPTRRHWGQDIDGQ
jgi:hypothetical protein